MKFILRGKNLFVMADEQFILAGIANHANGGVDLFDGADALEGFVFCDAGQFIEIGEHLGFVEQVFAEDTDHFFIGQEGRQDEVGEEAFGAVATPFVFFTSGIATAENEVVVVQLCKLLRNLQLR